MSISTVSPVSKIDLARLLSPQSGRSEEMEAVWQYILTEDKKLPDQSKMTLAEQRKVFGLRAKRWNSDLPDLARCERIAVHGVNGSPDVACDLMTPEGAKPGCLVFFHGGGWAFGSIDTHARIPRTLANTLKVRVLSVEYRLTPEHPYPSPLEDCIAAWRWAVQQASSSSDFVGPLTVAGDSAGANLAMGTIIHEQRSNRRAPDAGMLFYGVYGADTDTASYKRFGEGYGLARIGMERFFDWYAPGGLVPEALRFDPLISPLNASEAVIARLPPLYLCAAGLDPLLCDSVNFAKRLDGAGVQYDINIHEGLHHGFMQITQRLSEARRAYVLVKGFYDSLGSR
jgi:acetyl esterase